MLLAYTVVDPGFAPGRGQALSCPLRAKKVPKKLETSHFLCKTTSMDLKRSLRTKKVAWPGLQGVAMA